MFRFIRMRALLDLRDRVAQAELDRAEADQVAARCTAEATTWHELYVHAEEDAARTARLRAALWEQLEQALRERDEARAERDQAQADAQKEAEQQLAELREDFARIRDAAADSETGQTVRAAIAYRVLRDLYADALARGLEPHRPVDILGVVLGFDTELQPGTDAELAGEARDTECRLCGAPGGAPYCNAECRAADLADHECRWPEDCPGCKD